MKARILLVAALSSLALVTLAAHADPRGRDHDRSIPGRMVYDTRYHHDHYYPAVGFLAPGLPRASLSLSFGGGNYWYGGGVWYQPWGGRYRVIVPPIGIVVPVLPYDYVSLRMGGMPYYYANGVYYSSAPGGYVVVNAPPQADSAVAQPSPPPASSRPEPIVYPRNNQTAAQTEVDRQECNRWATTQPAAMNDASVFSRAVDACLDGKGYTVR